MAKVDELCELSMVPPLADAVARTAGLGANLQGTFTLNGVTNVVVAATALGPLDQIYYTLKTPGGTVGTFPVVKIRTNGVGFQVAGSASDTSVYDYRIAKA